jgi:hypothetical protein
MRTPSARLPRRTHVTFFALGLAGLAAGSIAVAACSSDSPASATTTTSSSTSGAGGAATNYCDNDSDEAARLRDYCPGERNIQDISGQCGLDCVLDDDPKKCVTDCILKETNDALSSGCATCVADTVVCAKDYCLNECLADTQGKPCLACRCGLNAQHHSCYDDYEHCAGRHLTDCDELDAGTWNGYPHYDAGCSDGGAGGAGGGAASTSGAGGAGGAG